MTPLERSSRVRFVSGIVACLLAVLTPGVLLAGLPRWEPLHEPGYGGGLVSVEVSPYDSRTMLIGGDVLGIGLSKDGGETWALGVGLTCREMGDFTWHPTNPDTIWAGSLAGPYKSTDGGETWTPKRNGFPPVNPDAADSAPIQKICFDPNNVNTLLAFGGNERRMTRGDLAARFGAVWKSTDGGENWTRLTTIDAKGSGPADRRGVNLTNGGFAAGSSDIVYACADGPQDGSGVYKSTDGGKSFTKAGNGLPNTEVCFIALHPTDPNTLWASVGGGKMYKSTDGAATWKTPVVGMESPGHTQRCAMVAVCKRDPDVLYTGGGNGKFPYPVFRSRNGGATWAKMMKSGGRSTVIGTSYSGEAAFSWISVDANDASHVLGLTPETCCQSWDGGASWRDITSHQVNGGWRGNGYGGVCGAVIKWNPFRPQQVFTLGREGAKLLSSNDGAWSWTIDAAPPDAFDGARDIAFTREGAIYVGFGQDENTDKECIGKSTDWGKTWSYVARPQGANGATEGVYALADKSNAVWAIIGAGVYKSADGGATWSAIALDNPGKLYSMAADPVHPLTIYIAAQNGIYRASDGAAFTLMPGSPGSDHGNAVVVDPVTPGVVYAVSFFSGGKGVWRYDGKWTRLFEKPTAYKLAVDPGDARRLAVVTKDWPVRDVSPAESVWVSEDGGAHWTQANEGLGQLRGSAIAFNPDKSGQLIVGTDGGFYVADWGVSTPFGGAPRSVAGTIQAEDYDVGGEGVSYHRSSGKNQGGDAYRNDAVSIRSGGSGHVLCNMTEGEWLKYRVTVPATGYYDATFRIASANGGGRFHLRANGVNVTGPISVPSTKDANAWADLVARGVRLHAGEQYLELYVESPGADLDYMRMSFSVVGVPADHEAAVRLDAPPVPAYPMVRLTNGVLTAECFLPDPKNGYYRGTRFDWSGVLKQVTYNGHVFYGPWKILHHPEDTDDIQGPAEEFGTAGPLGFDVAKPGETFIKIGVGWLVRTDGGEYDSDNRCQIARVAPWEMNVGADYIEFRQHLDDPRGWGYDYAKRITLTKGQPELVIEHTLINSGRNVIETDQYCHNFSLIDGQQIGTAYRVQLPFRATVGEPQKLRNNLMLQGDQVSFRTSVEDRGWLLASFLGFGDAARDNGFQVENQLTGGSISVSGDRAPTKVMFWSAALAVAVEPFIELKLAPGQEAKWTTRYHFAGPRVEGAR